MSGERRYASWVKALADRVDARSIGARMDATFSGVSSAGIGGTPLQTPGTRRAGTLLRRASPDSLLRSTRRRPDPCAGNGSSRTTGPHQAIGWNAIAFTSTSGKAVILSVKE